MFATWPCNALMVEVHCLPQFSRPLLLWVKVLSPDSPRARAVPDCLLNASTAGDDHNANYPRNPLF